MLTGSLRRLRGLGCVVVMAWCAMVACGCAAGAAFASEHFEIESFGVQTLGSRALQAGAHVDVSGAMAFTPSTLGEPFLPKGDVRDVAIDLPTGLVGNPIAVPSCGKAELLGLACPVDTQVGTAYVFVKPGLNPATGKTIPLYNLTPSRGAPAEFGFMLEGEASIAVASAVPSTAPGGYSLQLTFTEVPSQVIGVLGVRLTMWAVPADPAHDPERFKYVGPRTVGGQHSGAPLVPFLRNPTACGSAMSFTATADSWQAPAVLVSPPPAVSEGVITGCESLSFEPQIRVGADSSQVDTPAGYTVELELPQNDNPQALGAPDLQDATVTLPQGVSVTPSSAEGLVGCSPAQFGLGAIEKHGLRETGVPGNCPAGSQIATVTIQTPLLASPLTGHAYVASPECDPCTANDVASGHMIGLYLEAAGSGVVVKLKGTVSADPATGRLTAHFENTPQLPFSTMRMQLTGGPKAPLSNPQACGPTSTEAELVPWSWPGTPAAQISSQPFTVTGCQPGAQPFSPAFTAGTRNPAAGRFSTFTMSLVRQDGEQNLAGIQLKMPPGLLGMLSKVTLCGEPQASEGTCPASSQIGRSVVSAGAGGHPFTLSGPVYLTGPYEGQPFGLSVAVPSTAGPFTLAGDTGRGVEVVRASIAIDPATTALTVTSQPLPRIIDGIPLRLREITVEANRPEFIFNPTGCDAKQITGTLAGQNGALEHLSAPFAASGCQGLPFKPSFKASTEAATSRRDGASLQVTVGSSTGQANIHKVHVTLPRQLVSRVSTLNQACLDRVFESNPAACPAASTVGVASVHTPALSHPLSGPALFVSHGGAAFPDLEIVLQGEGITLILDGKTNIIKGITSSTFESVPDAPVTSFSLRLPRGEDSALAAPAGKLCTTHKKTKKTGSVGGLVMPTTITGQNGVVINQATKITVTGCPTAKHKHAKHTKK